MSGFFGDYLPHFGLIKFAEEKSMCISDFERQFKKYFSSKKKHPRGRYKFAETDKSKNKFLKDFKKSFLNFFR